MESIHEQPGKSGRKTTTAVKFIICSLIGIISFFVPINIGGESSILIDHIVSAVGALPPVIINTYILAVIFLGAVYPFYKKTWNKSTVNIVLSFFKIAGFVFAFMLVFNIGPAWLFDPNLGPFLLDKLIKPVGLLIPIGSIFLALLISYGLLEFVGVFMQPVMRPIFKTPGRSAVDAVASFVGSYSVSMIITNRLLNEGKYTIREASIIATGFSTVSVTFMVVIANTLDLMGHWNLFFWTSLVVTFVVTALTARIWPLSKMDDSYVTGEGEPEEKIEGNRLKIAWNEGLRAAEQSPSFFKNIVTCMQEGIVMTMNTLPSIMSVGLLGLILAYYTPLFDWLAYIFLPFTWILQTPEPLLTAKAAAISISEVFLPSLLVVEAELVTRFIVAVSSVSAVLFLSAVIPVILSTDIPIPVSKMIVIWFERVVLSLILVTPIALLIF